MSVILSSIDRLLFPAQYKARTNAAALIERAVELGLREEDATNAREMLIHNELEIALDTVLVQLYEYSIHVDEDFLEAARSIAKLTGVDWNKYSYMTEPLPK